MMRIRHTVLSACTVPVVAVGRDVTTSGYIPSTTADDLQRITRTHVMGPVAMEQHIRPQRTATLDTKLCPTVGSADSPI